MCRALLDGKGRPLGEGDDLSDRTRSSADSIIANWKAPADGQYAVEIRDLLQRGGPEYVYFLKIARAEPEFDLDLDSDKTGNRCPAAFRRDFLSTA